MASEWLTLPETARLLRAELAARFPGTTFRVRSSRFSGGTAISVSYHDPALPERVVAEVCDRFQGYDFDGMTDSRSLRPPIVLDDGRSVRSGAGWVSVCASHVPLEPSKAQRGRAARHNDAVRDLLAARFPQTPFQVRAGSGRGVRAAVRWVDGPSCESVAAALDAAGLAADQVRRWSPTMRALVEIRGVRGAGDLSDPDAGDVDPSEWAEATILVAVSGQRALKAVLAEIGLDGLEALARG